MEKLVVKVTAYTHSSNREVFLKEQEDLSLLPLDPTPKSQDVSDCACSIQSKSWSQFCTILCKGFCQLLADRKSLQVLLQFRFAQISWKITDRKRRDRGI